MITKKIHRNLEKPPKSWLRKTSEKTRRSSEIQMKNSVNQMKDQKIWPVPNAEASMGWSSVFSRWLRGSCRGGRSLLRQARRSHVFATRGDLHGHPRAPGVWSALLRRVHQ